MASTHYRSTDNRLRRSTAHLRLALAAYLLRATLKANPDWHLQPRVPAGSTDGGQWTRGGSRASGRSPTLTRPWNPRRFVVEQLSRWLIRRLRDGFHPHREGLRQLPEPLESEDAMPPTESFDRETGRIAPPTARRPGIPFLWFRNEREMRRILGPAGPDREWHHIVEQRHERSGRFPPWLIHNTDNVVNLPVDVHRCVTGKMSKKVDELRMTRRQWSQSMQFHEQFNLGLELIADCEKELGYDF